MWFYSVKKSLLWSPSITRQAHKLNTSLEVGLAPFLCKAQRENILGFAGHMVSELLSTVAYKPL